MISRFSLKRITAVLALSVAAAVGGVVATASPALAATGCPGVDTESGVTSGSASRVDFAYRCDSKGLSMWGTLHDTACDSKSAKLRVQVYHWGGIFGWDYDYGFASTNSNGCNTYTNFSYLGNGNVDVKINVCTWAASSWSSTSETCTNYYFY